MEQLSEDLREELPWYPFIAVERCKGCRTCFKFCRSGALVFNKTRKMPRLKYAFRCRVGCRICAQFCPTRAITFPDETLFIESYLHLYRMPQPSPLPSFLPCLQNTSPVYRTGSFRFSVSNCASLL